MVDAGHAQWAENGAGFHHSNQHGFGLLDAYRMTRVAGVTKHPFTSTSHPHTLTPSQLWPLVPPSVHWTSGSMKAHRHISSSHQATLTRNGERFTSTVAKGLIHLPLPSNRRGANWRAADTGTCDSHCKRCSISCGPVTLSLPPSPSSHCHTPTEVSSTYSSPPPRAQIPLWPHPEHKTSMHANTPLPSASVFEPIMHSFSFSFSKPAGYSLSLSLSRSRDGLKEWTFSTVKFWAEPPLGLWTLLITQSGNHGNQQTKNKQQQTSRERQVTMVYSRVGL